MAEDNVVEGNLIGPDVTGAVPLANSDPFPYAAVELRRSSDNVISGTAAGAGDVISANAPDGVHILDGSSRNPVLGNRIGTNRAGTLDLANGGSGVRVDGDDNDVGDPATALATNLRPTTAETASRSPTRRRATRSFATRSRATTGSASTWHSTGATSTTWRPTPTAGRTTCRTPLVDDRDTRSAADHGHVDSRERAAHHHAPRAVLEQLVRPDRVRGRPPVPRHHDGDDGRLRAGRGHDGARAASGGDLLTATATPVVAGVATSTSEFSECIVIS